MINHIAFIMDGNRRWAKKYKKSLSESYEYGLKNAYKIVKYLDTIQVKSISLWALSKDNMKRDINEIEIIYNLMRNNQNHELFNHFNTKIIGDLESIPQDIADILKKPIDKTKIKYNIQVNIFFNYSGTDDLTQTFNIINKQSPDHITIDNILHASMVKDLSPIDLLIRTSDRNRISNFCFLLLSFSELYFASQLWGEFKVRHLKKILQHYSNHYIGNFGA